MRTLALLWLSSAAFAQTGQMGMLSGKIVDEFGDAVSGASIQVKDATGKEFKATSLATGEYAVDKLQPGAYEVTVTALTMKNFVKKDLAVAATETSRLDVKLAHGGGQTLGTLGEGDRLSAVFFASLKRPPPPTGPPPRLPDGTPDLSGFWVPPHLGDAPPESRPEQPDPYPWADAIRRERLANQFRDLPDSRCLPAVKYAQGKFVHTPSILVMLDPQDPPRQIFLDGQDHPKELSPTWLGHSVGHWEGDTLVVDTVGFNGLEWIYGGLPATEALHVIERFHRTDLGHMETEMTMEDPPMLRKPWTQKRTLNLDPKEDLEEYICTENEKDAAHMMGK
jgi:hypothetical protein